MLTVSGAKCHADMVYHYYMGLTRGKTMPSGRSSASLEVNR